MRRTTLALEESLLRRLKQRAAAEDRTLADLVNELLRQAMSERRALRAPFRLELPAWPTKPRGGVDIADRDQLSDLMDNPAEKK